MKIEHVISWNRLIPYQNNIRGKKEVPSLEYPNPQQINIRQLETPKLLECHLWSSPVTRTQKLVQIATISKTYHKPKEAKMAATKCSTYVVLMLVMPLLMAGHITAISCSDALNTLLPCTSYLLAGEARPTAECCTSVRSLNKMAVTVASRRALCQCFKGTAPSFGVKLERAKGLLSLCKLTVNVAMTFNVNCSS